jgi:hypothetical protein
MANTQDLNDSTHRLSGVGWGATAPSWVVREELPEVLLRESGEPVPFGVWEGVLAQGQWLFDIKGDWGERYNKSRTPLESGGTPEMPYTQGERDVIMARITQIFDACESGSLELFWLSLWEQWLAPKFRAGRSWVPPTLAMLPCVANAYHVLAFHLKVSDCYLVRNVGNQKAALVLLDWPLPVARYVLDQALHRMREDYERKAVRLVLESEAEARGTTLEVLLGVPTHEFGLDDQQQLIFDLGTRQIQMTCDQSARTIYWLELPTNKPLKGFPRKRKADDEAAFALARLRYRSMRDELQRVYL